MDRASVVMRMHKSEQTKMIEKIDIGLWVPYGFPEKYENAVIRSVNMCSVKAHIVDAPDFEIMVKR